MPGINDHESVWCKLFLDEMVFLIGGVYRAPGTGIDFLEKIDDYLITLVKNRTKIILTGDFNLPHIDWHELSLGRADRLHGEYLFDIMLKYGLTQVVNEPTRIQGSCQSVLDISLVSDYFSNYKVCVEHGISDHKMVILTLELGSLRFQKTDPKIVYDFTRADDTSILDYLELSLDRIDKNNDVDYLWGYFSKAVAYCLARFVPKKTIKRNKSNPWITRDIIHLKRKLKRKRKQKNKNALEIANLSREVRSKVKAARTEFFSTTLNDYLRDSPRRFWQYLSCKEHRVNEILKDGKVCSNPAIVATEFNNFLFCFYRR